MCVGVSDFVCVCVRVSASHCHYVHYNLLRLELFA